MDDGEDGGGEDLEEDQLAQSVLLTQKLARLDASIVAISSFAKNGQPGCDEAKAELLNAQVMRNDLLEQRRRLQSPADQVKMLTRAKKTREAAVENARVST